MDAHDAFRFCYSSLLGGDRLLTSLTDDQIRIRPDARMNPMIWPFWHITRCEDVIVNRMIADRPQVFDRDNWPTRLGVSRRDVGSGMTYDEVETLRTVIDVGAFRAYRRAVQERTLEVVPALDAAAWDAPVTAAHAKRVALDDGMFARAGRWLDEWSEERSKGSWLFSHVINHGHLHAGEAFTILGMLGASARS
jgi:hypothetical protein